MITVVEKVLFLKSVDLFSPLPGEDLARIALICGEETHDAGEEIFAEGASGDALCVVAEGKVRVHRGGRTIAELSEKDCFGEMAILDTEPRSATVTALTEASLLKISREDFQEILVEEPSIALGVIKVLTRRLREAIQRDPQ
jgi:CRP/FNR family cyclic AMP-dependent transcriptional regulator